MMRVGLVPGPKAYHGLIFAYVKAGSAMGALYAIRRAHSSGVQMSMQEGYECQPLRFSHPFLRLAPIGGKFEMNVKR